MNLLVIVGGIAGVSLMLTGLQTYRLEQAQQEIGKLRESVEFQILQTEEAVQVNANNQETIERLSSLYSNLVSQRAADRQMQDEILLARDEELNAAHARTKQLQDEFDAIFREDPSCDEVAQISISATSPAVASRLRERTRDAGSNRDPNS